LVDDVVPIEHIPRLPPAQFHDLPLTHAGAAEIARLSAGGLRGAIRPRGVYVPLEPEAAGPADGAGHENYEATHGGTKEKKKQGEAFEIAHGMPSSRLGKRS
jgi:hypothetical protein